MSEDKQGRRQFCAQACQGVALTAVGVLGAMLPGCGSGGGSSPTGGNSGSALPVINATQSGNVLVLTIDAASPLSAVGSVALVQGSSGNFLVAHTGQDAFLAVSARCTHEACIITRFTSQTYICPCHGSQFSTNGRVLGGPATSPLPTFQAQFSNGLLTIS